MTSHLALCLAVACLLSTVLPSEVVLAESPENASAAELDPETPVQHTAAKPKSRYAGWLLGAYLAPPLIIGVGVAAQSGMIALGGEVLMWLAPVAVHLIAGEYGLAARANLILAFTAGGMILGALIGVAFAALTPEDPDTQEEDPGLQRLGGLVIGGIIGGALGALTWAVIDVKDAFKRDAKRREHESHTSQQLAFSMRPERGGLSIGVHGAF